MLVILSGIIRLRKDDCANALLSILVTPSGRTRLHKEEQP